MVAKAVKAVARAAIKEVSVTSIRIEEDTEDVNRVDTTDRVIRMEIGEMEVMDPMVNQGAVETTTEVKVAMVDAKLSSGTAA